MRNYQQKTVKLQKHIVNFINTEDRHITLGEIQAVFMADGYKAASVSNACIALAKDGRIARHIAGTYKPSPVVKEASVSHDLPLPDLEEFESTTTGINVPLLRGTFVSATNIKGNLTLATTYGVYVVNGDNSKEVNLILKFDNGVTNV